MIGEGREPKKDNDLFYTCSLIDRSGVRFRGNHNGVRRTFHKVRKARHTDTWMEGQTLRGVSVA